MASQLMAIYHGHQNGAVGLYLLIKVSSIYCLMEGLVKQYK